MVYTLLPTLQCAPFQQLHCTAFIFEAVPHVSQFRCDGTHGYGALDITPTADQVQQVPVMQTHPVACRIPFALDGDLLRANEYIGIVPVDENPVHVHFTLGQVY